MNQKKESINHSEKEFIFKIFRFNPDKDNHPYFQTYRVNIHEGETVLEALLNIQDEQDGSLAFRYSCRSAVCGSCGMTINGALALACKTQLQSLFGNEILIEPLPNMDIIKDMVVDMQPFWKAYEIIKPWLYEEETAPEKERLVSPKSMKKIDQYINCILCACCYGACPVLGRDEEYLGPAAIAKLFRFLEDPRDKRDLDMIEQFNDQKGIWACDTVYRCIDACPKEVRPTDGIAGVRRRFVAHKFKKFFRLNK